MKTNMKKNIKGMILAAIVAATAGISLAADCENLGGDFFCKDTEICNNPGGTCTCSPDSIANGATCNISVSDGVKLKVTGKGSVCSNDVDGCDCYDSSNTYKLSVSEGAVCTWTDTPVVTVVTGNPSVSVTNTTASYSFSSNAAGILYYEGSCGNGSLSNAIAGTNTVNYTSLSNKTYGDCKIVLADSYSVKTDLAVPSFTINYTAPTGGGSSPQTTIGGGYTSVSTICSPATHLVCVSGKRAKKANMTCDAGDLGKTCEQDLTGIIAGINTISISGYFDAMQAIRTNTQVTKVTEQETANIKVRLYTPNFSNNVIKNIINSLNRSVLAIASKKLGQLTITNQYIENLQFVTTETKTNTIKEVASFTKTYNDFVLCLYAILDLNKKDYLPVGQYLLKQFFAEFGKISK